MCPWNSAKLVRTTAESDYLARGEVRSPSATPLGGDSERAAFGLAPPLRGDSGSSVAGGAGSPGSSTLPGTSGPRLVELMRMTREQWDRWTRGSAIRRAGYAGFKRNVAVAIGNWLATVGTPPEGAKEVLTEALEDEELLVREHAGWALERARP